MKDLAIRRDTDKHISKKIYIPTFCGLVLAISAIAISLKTLEDNELQNDSSVLFKRTHFPISLQKDEGQAFPSYQIKLKFVTQHFAPVRNCTIKLTIDNEIIFKTHDINGVVTHNGQFKRSIIEDTFPIQVEITSGKGENTLTNVVQKDLVKSAKQADLYELQDQIIYKPNFPKETHIIGRVVDENNQPVAKAKITVSIYSPIFQDYMTDYTDENGKFNIELYLEQLTPIYGDMTIEADGFKTWNIMKDTKYTNGFYIINHLYFEFKEDIVLTRGQSGLSVSGFVQDHKTNQPYSGSTVSMECYAQGDPSNKQTFDIGISGEDGSFKFEDKNNFKSDQIICTVIAKPKSGSPLYEGRTQFTLSKDKKYAIDSVIVYVTTKPIAGYIKGKIVSETSGEPVPDVPVKLVTTSQIKINPPPVKTNEKGEFQLNLTGYESESKYEGYLVIDSDIYDPDTKYPITLKEEENYVKDAGVLKAKLVPKPQNIQIKGALFEQTTKEPVPDYDLTISITYSDQKVDKFPVKTDSDGMFSYEFTGKNTETYIIQVYAPENDKFGELKEVRELGPNKPFKYDADFKKIYLKRPQTNGKISGYLFDKQTNKPIENAKITVITDVPLPEQEIKCTNQAGNINCDFVVEKFQKYDAQIQVVTDIGLTGKAKVGELNMENKYTITDAKLGVVFEITPVKGIINGQVINSQTDQPITEGYYKVLSIDPPSENQDAIINKEIPYDKDGKFNIELDLHIGPQYIVKVLFTSPNVVENESIFELNFQNKYKIQDQKIRIGMTLNGFIDGHVLTKLSIPVADALVKVYVENYSSPFSGKTDGKGYYKVKIPTSDTLQVVKAKITVEKVRFKLYTTNIEFLKKSEFQYENFDIVLEGEFWKSTFSGKIVDENTQPVPFCSLQITLKDSFKEPTTDLPYSTVSLLNGEYFFDIDVSYNDNYTGYFTIKCNFFNNRVEIVELNTQNHYKIENRVSIVERQQILLEFQGTILNTLNEIVPNTSISLKFDYDSHTHKVQDLHAEDLNGRFELKEKILNGYVYKAKAEIKVLNQDQDKDYQNLSLDLEFNPYNNYKIYQEIEILKKFITSQISGQIFDQETQEPIQNAQAILHFTLKEFSKYTVFVYTNEKGEFVIKSDIQHGFEYKTKAEGKKTGYKDNSVDVLLNLKNNYQVADVKIYLTKAAEGDYLEGYIHGHGLSITGDPLPNSKVETYTEVDPSVKYNVNTDATGWFQLPNMKLIKGNVYAFIVELSPSDPNFNKKSRKIHLSVNDDYEYNNLTLAADRIRVKYTIKGKVGDKKSGLNLGGSYVIVSFIDQLFIDNSFAYSNKDGEFTLTGTAAKGLNYDGKFVIQHAGYETLTPQFTLQYNQSDDPNANYVKTDASYSLLLNPFQKLYYVDERDVIPIRSKVYERTTCKLYPNKYLPFVKVSLFIENRQGQEGTLIAETYTTLKGEFLINTPSPLFSDLQTYLMFERNGYFLLKAYQRITPNSQYIEQGPQQMNNRHGISDCSKKQRKIQNKFDKV